MPSAVLGSLFFVIIFMASISSAFQIWSSQEKYQMELLSTIERESDKAHESLSFVNETLGDNNTLLIRLWNSGSNIINILCIYSTDLQTRKHTITESDIYINSGDFYILNFSDFDLSHQIRIHLASSRGLQYYYLYSPKQEQEEIFFSQARLINTSNYYFDAINNMISINVTTNGNFGVILSTSSIVLLRRTHDNMSFVLSLEHQTPVYYSHEEILLFAYGGIGDIPPSLYYATMILEGVGLDMKPYIQIVDLDYLDNS